MFVLPISIWITSVLRHWEHQRLPDSWIITVPQGAALALILFLHAEVLKRIATGFGYFALAMSPGMGLATPMLFIWMACARHHLYCHRVGGCCKCS